MYLEERVKELEQENQEFRERITALERKLGYSKNGGQAISRMRTVKQCADYFKENDPEANIGEWCIRKWMAEGKLQTVKAGSKSLINLDSLLALLAEGDSDSREAAEG